MSARDPYAADTIHVLLALTDDEQTERQIAKAVGLTLAETRVALQKLHRACLADQSLPSGRWHRRGSTVPDLVRAALAMSS